MRSLDDCTLSSSRNAFTSSFLHRIGDRDEPPTSGEADAAGPWRVLELPGRGFGLFRLGEDVAAAVFRERWLALLAQAVFPGTGRDFAFRLQKEAGPDGFGIETGNPEDGVVGHLELFDERLVDALHVVDSLLRSPESLASLLEAAGQVALERAGAILDGRV